MGPCIKFTVLGYKMVVLGLGSGAVAQVQKFFTSRT
jgi:hypothetical protein